MDKSDMIFELVKGLNEKQDRQSETLNRVEADLKYHIRRTDLLEESIHGTMPKPTLKQLSILIGIISTLIGIAATAGLI